MLDIAGELKRVLDNFRGEDLTKLGSGMRRDVYRINTDKFGEQYKGKVVKYASKKSSLEDNRKEFSTWMSVKGTPLEHQFCPIRDRSRNFEFLVMDYARVASSVSRSDINDMQEKMEENFSLEGTIHDLYDGNFGYHDQYGLVVIDYPWGGNYQHESHNMSSLNLD